MQKTIFAALALVALAGCADLNGTQTNVREESYTPLGTLLPKKNHGPDERKYIDKEQFKNQQEMNGTVDGGQR